MSFALSDTLAKLEGAGPSFTMTLKYPESREPEIRRKVFELTAFGKDLPQEEAEDLEQKLYRNKRELSEDERKHNMDVIISQALDLPRELDGMRTNNTFEMAIKEMTEDARRKITGMVGEFQDVHHLRMVVGGVVKQLGNMSDFFLWTTKAPGFWSEAKKWIVWDLRQKIVSGDDQCHSNYSHLKMLSYGMHRYLQNLVKELFKWQGYEKPPEVPWEFPSDCYSSYDSDDSVPPGGVCKAKQSI